MPWHACPLRASYAALSTTSIPRVTVLPGASVDDYVLEVDEETFTLDTARVPLFVTLWMFGPHVLVDASREEEACAGTAVSVAVARDGRISALRQAHGCVTPSRLQMLLSTAVDVARTLFGELDRLLALEQQRKTSTRGFLS